MPARPLPRLALQHLPRNINLLAGEPRIVLGGGDTDGQTHGLDVFGDAHVGGVRGEEDVDERLLLLVRFALLVEIYVGVGGELEGPLAAPAEASGAEGEGGVLAAEGGEEGVEAGADGGGGVGEGEGEVPGGDAGEVVGAGQGGSEAGGFEVGEGGEEGGVEGFAWGERVVRRFERGIMYIPACSSGR